MQLLLTLLGGFDLTADGRSVAPAPRKVKALTAYLGRHANTEVSRDRLAELLWGDRSESRARQSLRQALTVLRQSLGEGADTLHSDHQTIRWSLANEDCDANAFARACELGDANASRRALDLYRGDLLEGFAARSEPFDEWLAMERTRFADLARQALTASVTEDETGQFVVSDLQLARRLLQLDPLSEVTHRTIMTLLHRAGRRDEALRQYELCRRTLSRDLAVTPDAATQALFAEIHADDSGSLSGTSISGGSLSGTPISGTTSGTSTLPAPGTPISGSIATGTPTLETPTSDQVSRGHPSRDAAPGTPTSASDTSDQASTETDSVLRHSVVCSCSVNNLHELDPELLLAEASAWHEALEAIGNRFGGRILECTPQYACMVLGLAHSRGDEVKRAARAVMELQQHTSAGEQAMEFGFGLAAGQLLVPAGSRQPLGAALGVARDLAAQASAGEILIAPDIAASLGISQGAEQTSLTAIPVHHVPDGSLTPDHEMVGRHLELQQMLAALASTRETGCGVTVIVRGEAGIGKSRLLEEAQVKGREAGFDVVSAQIYAEQGDGDALEQVSLGLAGDDKSFAAMDLDEEEQRVLHDSLGQHATEQDSAQAQVFWDSHDEASVARLRRRAMGKVLDHRTDKGPMLLVIEDIHWADAQTLARIAELAALTATRPVLLMLSTRLMGQPLDPAWRSAMEDASVMVLDLGPMRDAEAKLLAERISGAGEHQSRCLERAAGHPLILEQLLRHQEVAPAGAGAHNELPVSIQALVQARLDLLEPGDRLAAGAAAILARDFDRETLLAVLQQADYDPGPLLEQRLLMMRDGRWRFVHALIRDAVLASLLGSRRVTFHIRAAAVFAETDRRRQLHHLLEAGNAEAVPLCVELALQAQRNHRLTRARDLTERGLPLATAAEHRHKLGLIAGVVNRDLGDHQASLNAYAIAHEHADGREQTARAVLGRAITLGDLEQHQQALELLDPQFDAMEGLPHRLQADIAQARGAQLFAVGRTTKSWWSQQAAMEHARTAGSPLREARAENGMGDVEYARGNMADAVTHFSRAETLHDEHGFEAGWRAANLATMGMARLFLLQIDEGLANIHQGIRINEEYGYQRMAGFAYCIGAIAQLVRGDYTAALDLGHRAVRSCRAQNNRRYQAASLNSVALASAFLSEHSAAEEALAQCQKLIAAEQELLVFTGPTALVAQAMLADSNDERRALCNQAHELCSFMAISHCHFLSRLHAVMLFTKHGQTEDAVKHAQALLEWAGPEQPFADLLLKYAQAHDGLQRNPGAQRQGDVAALDKVIAQARSCGLGALGQQRD